MTQQEVLDAMGNATTEAEASAMAELLKARGIERLDAISDADFAALIPQAILGSIRAGDRVTIMVPNGLGRNGQEWKESTGRAVMRSPHGWALNMGGPHGTPGMATVDNIVRARKAVSRG